MLHILITLASPFSQRHGFDKGAENLFTSRLFSNVVIQGTEEFRKKFPLHAVFTKTTNNAQFTHTISEN